MICCPTKSSLIKNICDIYGLRNLIKDPTCHKGPISTLLDVILVSNPKRYVGVLNEKFDISDQHKIIGAATWRHAPFQKPKKIYYRSYKHFCENDYLNDIASAPFHVAHVFDDIDDIAWFHSSLIRNVIDSHAPIKSKIMRKDRCRIWIQNLEKHNLLDTWREINSNGLVEISGKKISAIETMLLISERNICQTTLPLAVKNMTSVFGKLFLHLCQIRNSIMGAV